MSTIAVASSAEIRPSIESAPAPGLDQRTRALLDAPIASTLLRLAAPNMVVMLAQASVGLIETYWIGKLGTDALAGVALVFPVVMLVQMTLAGVVVLVPLSPLLIFGLGPFPRLGVAGGATALLLYYALGSAVLAAYLWTGRSVVRPTGSRFRLRWPLFWDILRVGLVAALV